MCCEMDEDINECPFFMRATKGCTYQNKCSFQESESKTQTNNYEREPRWFEKYYK